MLGVLIKSPSAAILKHLIRRHDNYIHNNNDLKQMINNDNITNVENGVESNAAEKEIMVCSVSWLILDFKL